MGQIFGCTEYSMAGVEHGRSIFPPLLSKCVSGYFKGLQSRFRADSATVIGYTFFVC